MTNAFDLTVMALREQGLNSDEILEELSRLFANLVHSDNKFDSEDELEKKIRDILRRVCMPTHLTGYKCWVAAIKIYKKSHGKELQMVRDIYSQVAEACGGTPTKTERVMRFAVERTLDRCPVDIIESVFGNNLDIKGGKLKNSEFLAFMAELI